MIEYALKNSNDETFSLNGSTVPQLVRGSLTLTGDIFEFDNDVIENSALPGAVKLGDTRIMSKKVSISYNRAHETDSDFRTYENSLIAFLFDTVYLVDVTNSREVPVVILNHNISYDVGSYQQSSDNTIDLQLLEPFWTYQTKTSYSESLIIDVNTINIAALGSLKYPPILTFTASVAVTRLQIYIDENKQGIQIEDNLFGTGSNTELVLDCKNGTLYLGQYDRVNSIIPGTGFFDIPYTASTLIIIPSALCSVVIDTYRREYV